MKRYKIYALLGHHSVTARTNSGTTFCAGILYFKKVGGYNKERIWEVAQKILQKSLGGG